MAIVWKELGGAKISQGTFEAKHNTQTWVQVECGFKPKYIAVYTKNGSVYVSNVYDETLSTLTIFYVLKHGSEVVVNDAHSISTSDNRCGRIIAVNDTGFRVGEMNITTNKTMYYFAVG